jgi:hypothetical protein
MALSREQAISQYGTEAYTGWGEAEAQADWNAKGGGQQYGGGGGGSIDDILSSAVSSMTGFIKAPKPYETVNPFSFDEELAKQASTAEYAPYYQEMLSDYVTGVERNKSRSQEDLTRTMEQLSAGKEYYMGVERRALDKAMRQTNEGYAGRGLFFSGVKDRDIKELQTESEAQTGNYLKGYEYNVSGAQLGAERTSEDLALEQKMKERDITREQKYAVESGVLQRKQEAKDEYEVGRKKYEQNWYMSNYPEYYG